MANIDKKRPEQHRIDDQGLNIFRNSLPQTAKESWVFSTEEKDYGIDGEIQITRDEKHTGEFLKVQIKSKKSPKHSKDGKFISVSIDLKSAYFLIEHIKSPTALIVVDVTKKVAYWHPIQTDLKSRAALEAGFGQDSVTIQVSTSNVLSKRKFKDLYKYLNETQIKLSQKLLLTGEQSFNEKTQFLAQYEEETLKAEGYTPIVRLHADPVTKGTVFSIGYDQYKTIDYIPGPDFDSAKHLPEFSLTATFSTKNKGEKEKADNFERLVKTGKGTVLLDTPNVGTFKLVKGPKILEENESYKKGMKVTVSPAVQKRRHILLFKRGDAEFYNHVDIWNEDELVIIESVPRQVHTARIEFNPTMQDSIKFTLKLDDESIHNATEHYKYLDFFSAGSTLEIYISGDDRFFVKVLGIAVNEEFLASRQFSKLINALADIEKAVGGVIPYPLPKSIKAEDANSIIYLQKLLNGEELIGDASISIILEDPETKLDNNKFIELTQHPFEIEIFSRVIQLSKYKLVSRGELKKLTPVNGSKGTYQATIKSAKTKLEII
jgi:hypothetical protein